jgi:hypothetical protein
MELKLRRQFDRRNDIPVSVLFTSIRNTAGKVCACQVRWAVSPVTVERDACNIPLSIPGSALLRKRRHPPLLPPEEDLEWRLS